jgi:uncharacterized protein (TIGR03435 family)
MLRTLLEQRLALKAHHEVRRMSGYILSIRKGGPKFTETVPTNNPGNYFNRIKTGLPAHYSGAVPSRKSCSCYLCIFDKRVFTTVIGKNAMFCSENRVPRP